MQPIFKEFIKFLHDSGVDVPIEEGYYWFENNLIKAFTPDGVLHKLYRIKTDDNLNITYKKHKGFVEAGETKFETWLETAERIKHDIHSLVDESLAVIESVCNQYKDFDMYCLTSTGKDSVVTLDLVRKKIPCIKIMFNNTSLDVADTYKIVKSHPEWIITNPKEGFYNYISRLNYIPSRVSRGCCTLFKEHQSTRYFEQNDIKKVVHFMGVRNQESLKRADRQFIEHNPKWSNPNWISCLPIRKWSDLDIWSYIFMNNLDINPKYKKGYGRVGCGIACPYQYPFLWALDKYWYPNLYNRWHNILEDNFVKNESWTRLNCTKEEYHKCWSGSLYRPEPTKEVVAEFMKFKGIKDEQVALKYFNKICCECGKNVRHSDVVAMNLKFLGRGSDSIYCKKCLCKKINIQSDKWDEYIRDFKYQGCDLF